MTRYFGLGVRGRGASLGGIQVTGTPIPNLPRPSSTPSSTPAESPSSSGFTGSRLRDDVAGQIGDISSAPLQDQVNRRITGNGVVEVLEGLRRRTGVDVVSRIRDFRELSTDTLDVSRNTILNGSFVPVEKDGISSYRPEILTVTDFLSAFNNGQLTGVGNLIDFQYQASKIRFETLVYIFEQLENSRNGRANLSRLRSAYDQRIRNIGESLKIYNQILSNVQVVNKALDIKKYPSSVYDTKKFKTLKDFFTSHLQFTEDNWNQFAESKILLQMTFDLRKILENYSYNLFDIVDTDRPSNFSPVTLDTTYDLTDGFTFNVNSIRSPIEPLNASETSFFSQFVSSLPVNPDDKIKLLINLLSKELRVSKGLGTTQIQNDIQRDFGQGTEGNPFDNILGTVNTTIFDAPLGEGSLASIFRIDINEDVAVLPFENKYIDFESVKKTYVPGSEYLAETIVQSVTPAQGFNIQPYTDFVSRYVKVSSSVRNSITKLLQLDQQISSGLVPDNLFDMFSSMFRASIEGTVDKNSLNTDQLIINAVFKLSNTDLVLKNMLFQFCILAALDSSKEEEQRGSIQHFISDLKRTFSSLNFVRLEPGEDPFVSDRTVEFSELLRRLASDIEARVKTLVTTTRSSSRRTNTLEINVLNGTLRNQLSNLQLNIPSSLLGSFGNGNILSLADGAITSTLVESVEASGVSSNNTIKAIIDMYTSTYRLASDIANPVHLLNDLSHRTRFNFLSSTTIFLLIFETFASFLEKYSFQSFSKNSASSGFKIEHATDMHGLIIGSLENIIQQKLAATPKVSLIGYVPLGTFAGQLAGTTIPKIIPNTLLSNSNLLFRSSGEGTSGASSVSNVLNKSVLPSNLLVDALRSPLAGTNVKSLADFTNMLNTFKNIGANDRFFRDIALRPDIFRGFEYFISLRSIRNKLATENLIVENFLHIFEKIEAMLMDGKAKVSSNLTTNLIQQFLALGNQEEDLSLLKSRTQVDTMENIYQDFLSMTDRNPRKVTRGRQIQNSNFVIFDGFQNNIYNALLSFLSQKELQDIGNERSKLKVVSIGLPQNMTNQISDRINGDAITRTSFVDKEFDVVSINVYKRDLRREELVFKPKKLLFDLSLYQDPSFVLERNGRFYDFERLLETITLRDLSKTDGQKVNLRDLQNSTSYNFLQPFEIRQMVSNHVQSNLLNEYMNIVTGIDLTERNFTYNPLYEAEAEFNPDLSNLVLDYIRNDMRYNLPSTNVNELLTNESVPVEIRDMLQLISFGNILSKPEYVQELVISPKKFDRTFTFLLNVDDFEIDVEATRLTESGRRLLEKREFLSLIDEALFETQGIMKLKKQDDLRFDDFFLTVETLRGA